MERGEYYYMRIHTPSFIIEQFIENIPKACWMKNQVWLCIATESSELVGDDLLPIKDSFSKLKIWHKLIYYLARGLVCIDAFSSASWIFFPCLDPSLPEAYERPLYIYDGVLSQD